MITRDVVVSVLSSVIITGVLGGVTVWRDLSVVQQKLDDINASVVKVLDDHEDRIRILEKVNAANN